MIILKDYNEAKKHTPYCIVLGSFDGVHIGHQKLIHTLIKEAKHFNAKSMLYTFENHPRVCLNPDKHLYLITDNEIKTSILKQFDLDYLYFDNFDSVKDMSAEEFVRKILIDKFNTKCVIVGYNYRFGRNGEGDADALKQLGKEFNFKVEIVPAVEVNGSSVSSTLIRHMIRNGEVEEIPYFLGRHYTLFGKVVFGKQNGTAMGIRTANLETSINTVMPAQGVYLTDTVIDGKAYKSVTNVGSNPTFNGNKISIETHIIDFDENVYNKEIEIVFLKRQRDEIKFDSIDKLIVQIKRDVEARITKTL